jgi:hypothetical protein
MHIGILDELQMWLFPSMKPQACLNKYNAIRLSVPTYNDLTHKHYSYEEFFQWNGKDIKEMSQYLLGVVTQPLRGGSPTQYPIFNHGIVCTQVFSGSDVYAPYKPHDDATWSNMEDAFSPFPTLKDDFLLGQTSNNVKLKFTALRLWLVKK